MEDPTVLEIDLKPYVVKLRDYRHYLDKHRYLDAIPSDVNIGRQIAKDVELTKRIPHLLKIRISVPTDIHREYPRDSIWKGLFGPTARKLGTQQLAQLIDCNDQGVAYDINRYLGEEQGRIDARAKKKAKKEAMEAAESWTEPVQFFVPDIGTVIKLNYDWSFVLYQERRNAGFIELLNLFNGRVYQDWRVRTEPERATMIIRAGSELTVDRIYIRKGAEEYSSITFWLGKEAVVIGPDGTQHTPTRRIRFWAKLADVNKIQALVNKASVPGMT